MAKRIVIGFALVAIITSSAFAQKSQEKKKSIFGLAPGISESHFFINGGVGLQTYSVVNVVSASGLAIKASGDYVFETTLKSGAKVPVSFGVGLNYSIIKDYGLVEVDYGASIINVRAFYHFNFLKNLDTYAGLILGCAFRSNNRSDFNIGVGAGAGARYFFTKNIGIYADIEYLLSINWPFDVTTGIAVKF
jgi:opacity protein-like surface antigen